MCNISLGGEDSPPPLIFFFGGTFLSPARHARVPLPKTNAEENSNPTSTEREKTFYNIVPENIPHTDHDLTARNWHENSPPPRTTHLFFLFRPRFRFLFQAIGRPRWNVLVHSWYLKFLELTFKEVRGEKRIESLSLEGEVGVSESPPSPDSVRPLTLLSKAFVPFCGGFHRFTKLNVVGKNCGQYLVCVSRQSKSANGWWTSMKLIGI